MDDQIALKEIKRYKDGGYQLMTDLIVREVSLELNINDQRLISIACLAKDLEDLSYGFLFSEGMILDKSEIISSTFNREDMVINFHLQIPEERVISFFKTGEKTSGCGSSLSTAISGKKKSFSEMKFHPESILERMHKFQLNSKLFKDTGGVHSAGIVIDNKLRFFSEDIGRHNAVDKVVGMALREEVCLKESYLLCSGRISSEIVKKIIRLEIPLIVSQSAATSEAIRLGWKYKVFVIGFARGKRFNIYTGYEERIFD